MRSDLEPLEISADRTRIFGTGRYSERNRVACGTWTQDGIRYFKVWVDPVENGQTPGSLLERLLQHYPYGVQPIARGDLNLKELAVEMFTDYSHVRKIAQALMGDRFIPFRKARVRLRSRARILGTVESLFPKPDSISPMVEFANGPDELPPRINASR